MLRRRRRRRRRRSLPWETGLHTSMCVV